MAESKMASTSNNTSFEKLKGSENYQTWAFAMENYLLLHGLAACIDELVPETKAEKIQEAKARMVLAIDQSIYVHIRNEKTALEIWTKLKVMFEDKGLTRKIGLLRTSVTTNLENCDSMDDYISKIISTSQKLIGIGFDLTEEWIGCFLLAGLTDDFMPMIMGIESSGTKITGDSIKSKLYEMKVESKSSNSAFFGKGYRGASKHKGWTCYSCGQKGHKADRCPNKKHESNDNARAKSKQANAFSAVFLSGKYSKNEFYIDSGASQHFSPNLNWLTDKKSSSVSEIVVANDTKLPVSCVGNMMLNINGCDVLVKDVLCVPDLTTNLLSVAKISENQNTVQFDSSGCIYNSEKELVAKGVISNGIYKLDNSDVKCLLAASKSVSLNLWHRRLGHMNYRDMCRMRNGAVNGVTFDGQANDLKQCEVCCMGKQPRLPFKNVGTRAEGLLDLVHSDLCGFMEVNSIGGARYFLTMVDDFSRKTFIYLLKSKTEVYDIYCDFKALVENQTGSKFYAQIMVRNAVPCRLNVLYGNMG